MKRIITPIIFGLVCLLLSCAITMQLKLEQTTGSHTEKVKITDKLKDQIIALNSENAMLSVKLEKITKDLEDIRDNASKNDSSNKEKSELIKKYTILSGETDIYGQGVIIDYSVKGESIDADIAKDLRDIVNELKNAGAEAITINGERLIENSSIEMVKNKIQINEKQLNLPYVIKAIGDADTINSSLTRPDGVIELLKSNKNMKVNIKIENVNNMKILKKTEF